MYTNQPLKEPTRSHGMQRGKSSNSKQARKKRTPHSTHEQVTQQENKNRRKVGPKQHKAGKGGLVVETQSKGQYASVQMRRNNEGSKAGRTSEN